MLQSFLTITFRILWRNKVTSFVNILGLGIGMASVVFIMLYVQHETAYDKFNENYSRIYRLEGDDFGKLPPIVGSLVNDRLPEVTHVARLAGGWKAYISYSPETFPERVKQVEVNHFWADSTTFQVFTFPFLQGDPSSALRQPMTVVLTESTAKKLFGDANPVMKTIKFDGHEFMVTGIIRDIKNSHIEIDVLFSFSSIPKIYPEFDWNKTASSAWLWSATYLLMTDNIDEKHTEKKINQELKDINGTLFDTEFRRFHLRAFSDLYFEGNVRNQSYGLHGNLNMIRTLLIIGIFILFLAGINYTNLTTARAAIRTKEVAVKRITGSSVNQLRAQLILESIIVSAIALVVAMTFIQLGLPAFNRLTMVNISQADVNSPAIWMAIALGSSVLGLLAGIYPAFYLTAAQPVHLMKGQWHSGSNGSMFRSALMTFQFTLSIVMIIAVIINFRQMRYTQNADLGFDKKQIVTVVTPDNFKNEFLLRRVFKERLLQHAGIERVTYSYGNPGEGVGDMPLLEINGMKRSAKAIYIDNDYTSVMGITFSDGRSFSQETSYDSIGASTTPDGDAILVNESLVREFGLDHPVGQVIYAQHDRNASLIVGVVKDFHYQSFHEKIEPMILMRLNQPGNVASIKIASSDIAKTIGDIEAEWKRIWGDAPSPFAYKFLDDTFNQLYTKDVQLTTSIGYFTGLAVVIACLGLFALSSFMVSRRTKEIGVRKTLGASLIKIYCMLSWDFLKWILLAVLIACPIAWFIMQQWLETFAYHVTIETDVFVMAAMLSIAIALITVTWQSLKAARANPVNSLRYE